MEGDKEMVEEDLERTVHKQGMICAAAQCTKGLATIASVDALDKEIKSLRNSIWVLVTTFLFMSLSIIGGFVLTKGGTP
jgi:hypothetical protein